MTRYKINSNPPDRSDLIMLLSRSFSYIATPQYVKGLLDNPNIFFSCAYSSGDLVGFVNAENATKDQRIPLNLTKLDTKYLGDEKTRVTAYITNLSCASFLRNNGVGKALLEDIALQAGRRGYDFVAGHYREGSSLRAAVRTFPDFRVAIPHKHFEKHDETFVLLLSGIKRAQIESTRR